MGELARNKSSLPEVGPTDSSLLRESRAHDHEVLSENIPGGFLRGDITDAERDPQEEMAVIEAKLAIMNRLLDATPAENSKERKRISGEIKKLEERFDYFSSRN